MLSKLFSGFYQKLSFTAASTISKEANQTLVPNSLGHYWNATATRNKIRYYFPNPNERRRVVRSGWMKRISTPNGLKMIRRRILKGRYILTH